MGIALLLTAVVIVVIAVLRWDRKKWHKTKEGREFLKSVDALPVEEPTGKNAHRRAFDIREQNDPYLKPYPHFAENRFNVECLSNFIDLKAAVAVHVGKTSDTNSWVISITDVDGNRSSLWLTRGDDYGHYEIPVRAITPY